MNKADFLKLLEDEDVRKALKGKGDDDLLEEITITEDDTLESLTKKYNDKLKKVVTTLNKKIKEAENTAVKKVTDESQRAEAAKIQAFSKDHPHMSKPEVIAIMDTLYSQGVSLEDCYARACKANDLEIEDNRGGDDEGGDDKTKKPDKAKKPTSIRKTISGDDDGDDDDDDGRGKEEVSIKDIVKANSAEYIAKNGSPFEEKNNEE